MTLQLKDLGFDASVEFPPAGNGALKSLGGVALLERAGIDPARRAETLAVGEFDRLARLIDAAPR